MAKSFFKHFMCFICFTSSTVFCKSFVFEFDQDQALPSHSIPEETAPKCGYQSCNPVKDDMINVHLVPHTHDDVGWLKTVDQYFYGDMNDIQRAGVQYILDSVIPQLQNDPNKRFIYVEIAFFKRWWNEQHDSFRHVVKGLVNNGQLEFILGGWSMNDEATTHYNAIIDQHTLGFRFLQDTFGECARPRVAWQIDPFGHSREQASLFAQMGFDGLFFGRLDYQDKAQRELTKTMEMIWQASANLGSAADLFTGALQNVYSPPEGFCFDILCDDDPIMDDKRLHGYNVPAEVADFLDLVSQQAQNYATNHLIMTMGSDFQYSNANSWYKNLDKLIQYVNAQQTKNNTKVNLLYSTPSCYLYQLNRANKTWTTKQDDFFPYAHRGHSFWTGYFTSRAALKGYVRQTNNFLQVCKQLDASALLEDTEHSSVSIQVLKEALAVAQHHDAVSGTEKQAVAYDYAQRLAYGIQECQKTVNDAYKKLLNKTSTATVPDQLFCGLMNISMCNVTEINKQFVVVVYNPIGRPVDYWVRLPVATSGYQVTGPDGKTIQTQVVAISNRTKQIPERDSSANYELVFFASGLPPLGFSTYFVQLIKASPTDTKPSNVEESADIVLKNKYISLTFDSSGNLYKMSNLVSKISLPLKQQYGYYTAYSGNNSMPELQASGAYVFRPNNSSPTLMKPAVVKRTAIVKGELVQEIEQIFTPWISQVVRLYKGAKYAEFEWTVGPIPIQDNVGKEVISRFQSNIANDQIFYTDSNGREMQERKLNYRPSWKLDQTEPVAGNYYPVNSRIYIKDDKRAIQLTVLTDRSQGGTSLNDGEVELMVHRRTLCDDALGVGEALNETGADGKGLIIRGKHYVILESVEKSAAVHRDLALRLYMAPSLSMVKSTMKQADWSKQYRTMWSGLQKPLPANVHMLSLEQWRGNSYLVRLENFYEQNEDKNLSKTAQVSMKDLFTSFDVESVEELSLGANEKTADMNRLKWKHSGKKDNPITQKSSTDPRDITLTPMQIRTYQATFKPKPIAA